MAKKKLIRINSTGTFNPGYSLGGMAFTMVTGPADGRRQCFPFYTCRDHVVDAVKEFVCLESDHYQTGKYPPVDMETLRLVIGKDFSNDSSRDAFKAKLFAGKKAINIYETIAGWSPSKITTVVWGENSSRTSTYWMITGPKQWMAYPQMLSLLMLILRIFTDESATPTFANVTELQSYLGKLAATRRSNDVVEYLAPAFRHYPEIFMNWDKVFCGGLEEAYHAKAGSGGWSHGVGGILSLITGRTTNKILYERFRGVILK